MVYDDLIILLKNFDTRHLEAVACYAQKLAEVSVEKWTGELSVHTPLNQGGISGDVKINRGETVKLTKKRRVRSSLR